MSDNENQQALRFFLNSDDISGIMADVDDVPVEELETLEVQLAATTEQQMMDCLRLSHQVLISENPQLADINSQIQNKTALRNDVTLALAIAQTLDVIKENPVAVATLVLSARVLAANKLKLGKLEYEGSSVFADLLSLLKLTVNKKND